MASELKPCPYCKGAAELDYEQPFCAFPSGKLEKQVAIYCTACDAHMSMCYSDFPEYDHDQMAAILTEKWNTRPAPAPVFLATEDGECNGNEAWEGPLTDEEQRMIDAAWETHKAAKPAPAATDKGLVTYRIEPWEDTYYENGWTQSNGWQVTEVEDPEGEWVKRSRAEELLAAERAEKERLRDSTLPMACDPDEWTAAEEVLAHLLINVVGVPDDVPYTPNQAQEIIERQLKRVRELDDIEEMLMDGQGDDDGAQIMPEFEAGWSTMAKVEECLHLLEKRRDVIEGAEALEAKLAAAIEALIPFADCCDHIREDEDDEEWAKFRLLVKDYRRARAAVKA